MGFNRNRDASSIPTQMESIRKLSEYLVSIATAMPHPFLRDNNGILDMSNGSFNRNRDASSIPTQLKGMVVAPKRGFNRNRDASSIPTFLFSLFVPRKNDCFNRNRDASSIPTEGHCATVVDP